jgi:hypothetical protein
MSAALGILLDTNVSGSKSRDAHDVRHDLRCNRLCAIINILSGSQKPIGDKALLGGGDGIVKESRCAKYIRFAPSHQRAKGPSVC